MGRKVIAFWLSLTMVLSLIVVLDVIIDFTPTVKGGIIRYVNETGGGGAYTKIQDAINASSDGDTVFVYNGTYYENVIVNKTINLTGENRDSTIIDGGGNGNVVNLTSDWINLTDFTITNSGSSLDDAGLKIISNNNTIFCINIILNNWIGIRLDFSSGNNIIGNAVSNNEYGIYLYKSLKNNISANYISNNEFGMYFDTSSNINIKNNNVSSNRGQGLFLTSSSNNNITSNNILNNWLGISLEYSLNNDISNNNFTNDGVLISGDNVSHYNSHNIPTDNIVNGDPLYYHKDRDGINIDGIPVGQLILANCTDINVKNLQISKTDVGMKIAYSMNLTIEGNNVYSCDWRGIYFDSSSNNNIIINNVYLNQGDGFYFESSSSNAITGNNVTNNDGGIYLDRSSNNNLTGNDIYSNNGEGIFLLWSSDNNNITGNNVSNNANGIQLSWSPNNNLIARNNVSSNNQIGIYLTSSTNNTIRDNNVSSNNWDGIYIWSSSNGNTFTGNNISSNNNGIRFSSSSFNIITGNNLLINDNDGIWLRSSSNNNITNNSVYLNSENGIILDSSSSNNKITFNNISLNSDSGIYLLASSKNNLTSNYISSNGRDGIYLISSANNDISNNEIYSNNLRGIFIDSSSYNIITENNISSNNMDGIHYWKSSNNNITSNDISNNDNGIFLRYLSDSNLIISNNISNNQCGINLSLSSNNRIYHNNIITNTYQALDDQNDNFWDNGYPSGGNYWSDYGGVDNFKGPNQNIPGKDGIGDNPYDIDSDSRDNYPLLEPWKYYMILKQGWNLISLPLIQEERNLTKVLGSIDGWYDAVQWFNPKDIDDPWKHHKINKPYGNDLFEITEKMGFWIHITRPGDTIFIYNGTLPIQNLSISLTQGWNHVGYPSFTKHNRTEGLNNLTFYNEVDSIWTYSAATQKWKQLGPLDFFEPCKGYWIHAKTKCEWEVPL